MKFIALSFTSVVILFSCSSKKELSAPKNNSGVKSFHPSNYLVLDSAMGDLNMDRVADKIVIYKSPNESTEGASKRPLEIYLGQADGSFIPVEGNDNVVLCYACGGVFGDPYEDVTIENGSFTVSHYGGSNWRWSRAITFSFVKDQNTWVLTDDSGVFYDLSDEEKTTETQIYHPEDFGKVRFKAFDYDKGT